MRRGSKSAAWPLPFAVALSIISPTAAQAPFVAVTAIVEQAALDAVRDGLRDGLSAVGLTPGRGLRFEFASAKADLQAAAAIVRGFAAGQASVVVAISLPSAQAALAAAVDVPVAFVGAERPGAGMANLPENMTGLIQPPPAAATVALMRELVPGLTRIGYLRGPASARGDAMEAGVQEAARAASLEVVSRTLATPEEAGAAVTAFSSQAQAILLADDAAIQRAMPAIVTAAEQRLRPLFALDPAQVPRGAMAAFEYDNYRVGLQLAVVVVKLLRGEKPSAIPVENAVADRLWVNIDAAERTGAKVPPAVLARAAVIVD